ncbi:MAG TPA: hypothetical protein PK280_15510 [Planctomycetota bacterium]|nr:hypothetical protein [Planctomycetota bacterium]
MKAAIQWATLCLIPALATAGVSATAVRAPAGEQTAPAGGIILDEGSWWRCALAYRTPVKRVGDKLEDCKREWFATSSPPVPSGWEAADFDDSSWARWRLPRKRPAELDCGFWQFSAMPPTVSCQVLRGKFRVDDLAAARDLKLSLAYRGGVVVYLNGKEIARGHLPAGALAPDALAEDYPLEAFEKPEGGPIRTSFSEPEKNADRLAKRIRRLDEVGVPAAALRKGVNVLAVESVRAPYAGTGLEKEDHVNSGFGVWSTCGLVSLRLTAAAGATPNLERPSGFQVWTLDRNDRVTGNLPNQDAVAGTEYGDPVEGVLPITLVGARNGFFSGQVVASSTEPIKGLKAEAGDLKGPGTIPASAVRVRYAVMDAVTGGYRRQLSMADGLVDQPPAEVPVDKTSKAAAQQILVTVRVPKDAAPGAYAGILTVSATGVPPVAVPVKLSVAAWTVPDPANFRTFVFAYQSPTAVALQYKVPEWSEEHWKFEEKSFELLGQLGNKAIHIAVVEKTQLGNDEGMVYWVRKEDGTYEYDFTVFDRYLKLAKKHCGPLDYVVCHVWHAGGWADRGVKQENKVTVIDKKTGAREHMQVPEFSTEEAKKFWKPALAAIQERLAKEGMAKAMVLGTLSDSTAPKSVFQMFAEIAPGVPWHRGCHTMNPQDQPYEVMTGAGAKVSLHEHCYGMSLADPRKPLPAVHALRGNPGTAYFRGDFDYHSPECFRLSAERALFTRKQGIGRFGLDFWNVLDAGKGRLGKRDIYNRWPQSSCDQRQPTTYRVASPGPDGAVPTLRFEAIREGLAEAEALIVVSEAADKGSERIGKELTEKIRALMLDRLNACRNWNEFSLSLKMHTGWQDLNRRLFSAAAEVAEKTGQK